MLFVFAAGGTGGHLFPALAVAQALRLQNIQVQFFVLGKELEKKLLEKAGFTYVSIPFFPVIGKGFLGMLRAVVVFPWALARVIRLYLRLKPRVVVGFGGYPSFVPVVAAWMLRIPVALQEQNVQPGLANRVLSIFSRRVFAVPGAKGFRSRNIMYVENPVRHSFYDVTKWKEPASGEPIRVFVFGGSQGAVGLNSAILDLVPLLKSFGVFVVHQTGTGDYDRVRSFYDKESFRSVEVLSFIEDMVGELERAHFIICRAGALTVAEVVAARRPAIFVPLPIAGAHQKANVQSLVSDGGALMVEQGEGFSGRLSQLLEELLRNPEKLCKIVDKLESNFRIVRARPDMAISKELIMLGS